MSIKILGGVARGFTLATPKTLDTRPTSVMIRRKLFDWRQNLDGFIFIDLCAGSGAMGFEALSRGAQKSCLNDSQRPAFLTLKNNAENFFKAFKLEAKISGSEALKWIQHELNYEVGDTEESIIYVDPPYSDHALYHQILEALKKANYKGEVWIESDTKTGPKDIAGVLQTVIKTVESGDHFVVVGFLV